MFGKKGTSKRPLLEDAVWNPSGTGIFVANASNLEQAKSKEIVNIYLIKPKFSKSAAGAVVKSKIIPSKSNPHTKGVASICRGHEDLSFFTGGSDKSIVMTD